MYCQIKICQLFISLVSILWMEFFSAPGEMVLLHQEAALLSPFYCKSWLCSHDRQAKAFCACLSHQIVLFGQSIGLYGLVHTYNLTFTDIISTPLTSISGLLQKICTRMWKEAGFLWENHSTRFWGSMGTPPNGTTCGTKNYCHHCWMVGRECS